MIKVLIIAPDFYPSSTGFSNATMNLVQSILKYGKEKYELHIWTAVQLKNQKEFSGCEVHRFKKNTGSNRISKILKANKIYKNVDNLVKKLCIDVIFFETNTFPFWECRIAKKYSSKIFVRIHSTADTEVPIFGRHRSLYSKIESYYMKKFIQLVPNIVSTSDYYLDFIKNHYLDNNVYKIWSNKSYYLLYNTAGAAGEQEETDRSNTFITMGKMSKNGIVQKGISDVIKAIYYLDRKEKLPLDFKMIIIGNGEMYQYLYNYAKKLNICSKIEFIQQANHKDVLKMIRLSKAVVLLSRYEGQSMFITEAISCGKPLVITKDNGMQGMIKHDINGFLVKKGDACEAAEQIEKIISMTDDALKEMEFSSKKIYNDYFSEKAIYDQFNNMIELSM